jgi:hypothetical protein
MRIVITFLAVSASLALAGQTKDTGTIGPMKNVRVDNKTEKQRAKEDKELEEARKRKEGLAQSRKEDEEAEKAAYKKEVAKEQERIKKRDEKEKKREEKEKEKRRKAAMKAMEKGDSKRRATKPIGQQ